VCGNHGRKTSTYDCLRVVTARSAGHLTCRGSSKYATVLFLTAAQYGFGESPLQQPLEGGTLSSESMLLNMFLTPESGKSKWTAASRNAYPVYARYIQAQNGIVPHFSKDQLPLGVGVWEYQSSIWTSIVNKYRSSQLKPDEDEALVMAGIIESSVLWAYLMLKSNGIGPKIAATLSFVKSMVGAEVSLSGMAIDLIERTVAGYNTTMEFQTSKLEELAATLNKGKSIVAAIKDIREAPIIEKVHEVLYLALLCGITQKEGLPIPPRALEKYRTHRFAFTSTGYLDLSLAVAELIIYVVETSITCLKEDSLYAFLRSGKSYEKWAESTYDLEVKNEFLACAEAHNFEYYAFINGVKNAIETGELILANTPNANQADRKLISFRLTKMKLIMGHIVTRDFTCSERPAPLAILIFGASQVGKSSFTKSVFYHYGKTRKNEAGELTPLPVDDHYKYPRNAKDQYWTNYFNDQWCVQIDDVAFQNVTAAEPGGDRSVNELLQMVNVVPYVLTMAAIEDKGRVAFKSRLVIATTNTPDLNVNAYYSNGFAALRRFKIVVDIVPKAKYAKTSGEAGVLMLDDTKIPTPVPGVYPDLWDIRILEAVAINAGKSSHSRPGSADDERINQRGKMQPRMGRPDKAFETVGKPIVFDKMDDFLEWYRIEADTHETNQKAVLQVDNYMKEIHLCPSCHRASTACTCLVLQSRRISEIYDWWRGRTFNSILWIRDKFKFTYRWLISDALDVTKEEFMRRMRHLGDDLSSHASPWLRRLFAAAMGAVTIGAVIVVCKNIAEDFKSPEPKLEFQTMTAQDVKSLSTDQPGVWYKDDYRITHLDIGAKSKSWNSLTMDQIIKRLDSAVIAVQIDRYEDADGNPTYFPAQMFGVKGDIWMTTNHSLPSKNDVNFDIFREEDCMGVNSNVRNVKVPQSDIYRIPDKDLAFVRLPIPPVKDNSGLFTTESLKGVHSGLLIGRCPRGVDKGTWGHNSKLGTLITMAATNIHRGTVNITNESGTYVAQDWRTHYAGVTTLGDCGAILLAKTNYGPVVLGVHHMGMSGMNAGACTPVSLEMLEEVYAHFGTIVIDGPVPLSAPSVPVTMGPLHPKSILRYMESGDLHCYGSINAPRRNGKSDVQDNLLRPHLESLGWSTEYMPPILNGWEIKHNAVANMKNSECGIPTDLLKEAAEIFAGEIFKGLTDEQVASLGTVDWDVAINGVNGIPFMDRINASTSAGHPYNTSKKKFITIVPQDDNTEKIEFTPEIQDRAQDCWDQLGAGIRYKPICTMVFKDEPRKAKKIAEKKTRGIMVLPVEYILCMRRLFLPLVRLFYTNHTLFEALPGMAANTKEWDELARKLEAFSKRLQDGDYTDFQGTTKAPVILNAFQVLYYIMDWSCMYEDEDLVRVKTMAADLAFPMINLFGELVQLFGIQASGHALTTIINCIGNSLYHRCAYKALNPKHEMLTFRENVLLYTYGDDSEKAVKPEADWYSHNAISKYLTDRGVPYTDADKKLIAEDYKSLEETNVLKRKFRYEPELDQYLGPLDMESIMKMTMVNVKSKTLDAAAQCVATVTSAGSELALHGREVYDSKMADLKSALVAANIPEYWEEAELFKSWDEQVASYEERSKGRSFF